MVRIASAVRLLASLPLILASPANLLGREDLGRGGCGTETTEEFLAAVKDVMSLDFPDLASERVAASFAEFAPPTAAELASFGHITITTWVHIIAASELITDGYIPDSQIYAQMDEVNANFGMFHTCPISIGGSDIFQHQTRSHSFLLVSLVPSTLPGLLT